MPRGLSPAQVQRHPKGRLPCGRPLRGPGGAWPGATRGVKPRGESRPLSRAPPRGGAVGSGAINLRARSREGSARSRARRVPCARAWVRRARQPGPGSAGFSARSCGRSPPAAPAEPGTARAGCAPGGRRAPSLSEPRGNVQTSGPDSSLLQDSDWIHLALPRLEPIGGRS